MPTKTEAVEVFRQFAWNLAGKLVVQKSPRRTVRPTRPASRGKR
jgi:hypothetical protein